MKLARLRAAIIRESPLRCRLDHLDAVSGRADCAALDVLDAEMKYMELTAACMAERPYQRSHQSPTREAASAEGSRLLPPDHSTADAVTRVLDPDTK